MNKLQSAAPLLLVAGLSACAPATQPANLPDPATYRPAPGETRLVEGLGEIGLWMLTKELKNATWLGEPYQGRVLREPINVVLIDPVAGSAAQAAERMLRAMDQAGYGPKNMHSDGYYGYLGAQIARQYPKGKGEAFSDGPWYASNNHGRMFGPFQTARGWVFTGAFSREDFRLLPRPGHPYNSFEVGREDLATQLTAKTVFKRAGYVDLGSRIDTASETTADHDGRAALLVAGP